MEEPDTAANTESPENTATNPTPAREATAVPITSQPSPTVRPLTNEVGGKSGFMQRNKKPMLIGLILLALLTIGLGGWYFGGRSHSATTNNKTANSTTAASAAGNISTANTTAQTVNGLTLDTKKNYGNKYQNGLLPVGDNKYVSDAAKTGYIYTCSTYAQNLKNDQGGAGARGPWFTNNNTEYDINKKVAVNGSVSWQPSFSNTVSGDTRTIATNDLPNHVTGVYPIASSDPAYSYDRNPNSIKNQTLSYVLVANPSYGTPNCMGGEVGVMLTGVAIFNGFDAGGRDAGAWEVQDGCSGHPEKQGEYHYHTLSSCIKDTSVSTVIGYALDGFPITGPKVGDNNILTTSDLDECHGITSTITVDGKQKTTYHYVMTQDFPYSASCFRAKAIQPPGMLAAPGGSSSDGTGTAPASSQTPPPPRH